MTQRDDSISLGDVSGTVQIESARLYTMRLVGDVDFAVQVGGLGVGERVLVSIQQDGVGGHSVTWPSNVLVPTDEPALPSDADDVQFIELIVVGDFFGMWAALLNVLGNAAV